MVLKNSPDPIPLDEGSKRMLVSQVQGDQAFLLFYGRSWVAENPPYGCRAGVHHQSPGSILLDGKHSGHVAGWMAVNEVLEMPAGKDEFLPIMKAKAPVAPLGSEPVVLHRDGVGLRELDLKGSKRLPERAQIHISQRNCRGVLWGDSGNLNSSFTNFQQIIVKSEGRERGSVNSKPCLQVFFNREGRWPAAHRVAGQKYVFSPGRGPEYFLGHDLGRGGKDHLHAILHGLSPFVAKNILGSAPDVDRQNFFG